MYLAFHSDGADSRGWCWKLLWPLYSYFSGCIDHGFSKGRNDDALSKDNSVGARHFLSSRLLIIVAVHAVLVSPEHALFLNIYA